MVVVVVVVVVVGGIVVVVVVVVVVVDVVVVGNCCRHVLAIVAPGIAEALFATAIGLLAAIPAVIAYNKFGNDSKKYSQKLENFSKRFISII